MHHSTHVAASLRLCRWRQQIAFERKDWQIWSCSNSDYNLMRRRLIRHFDFFFLLLFHELSIKEISWSGISHSGALFHLICLSLLFLKETLGSQKTCYPFVLFKGVTCCDAAKGIRFIFPPFTTRVILYFK